MICFFTAESDEDQQPRDSDHIKTKRVPKTPKNTKKRNGFGNKNRDVDIYLDDDNRKKGKKDDSLKQDNAWDVITKKYDWNDKHSNEDATTNKRNVQKKFKNSKFDDDWNTKVTKQDFDDWNKKTTKRDTYNDKKDKNNKWDSVEKKPKKKDFDDSYQKPRKERKNEWDEVTVFKIATPKTTKKWKKELKEDWDNVYYSKPRNKKSRDSYDSKGFGRTPIPYVGRQGIYADQ